MKNAYSDQKEEKKKKKEPTCFIWERGTVLSEEETKGPLTQATLVFAFYTPPLSWIQESFPEM